MKIHTLFLLVIAAGAGCAHVPFAAQEGPPLEVEVKVNGLKQSERELLERQVCGIEGVTACETKVKGKEAKIAFTYKGSLDDLQRTIAKMPHPGLNPQKAGATLTFEGYDNVPPTIVVSGPQAGEVLSDKQALVVLEVKDKDVTGVFVGDERAAGNDTGRYSTTLMLQEGKNEIVVRAVDEAGNEGKETLVIVVDTTPPALEVRVKPMSFDRATIEGRVEKPSQLLVDGREVKTDLFGSFALELAIDPDRTTVEVTAIDEHGNRTSQRRSLKDGTKLTSR